MRCAQSALQNAFVKRRTSSVGRRKIASMEEWTMPRAKQASKRKRRTRAVPVLGAAGLLSLTGGASAATGGPAVDMPTTQNSAPGHEITLGEEEISDVSLATFYVFDKENAGTPRLGEQLAWGCRCGGCRGCRCGGCRCGWRGCAGGGCGGGCCSSWGRCRWC